MTERPGESPVDAGAARADWERRIGRQAGARVSTRAPRLPAPTNVRAASGRGQVTVDWDLVDGAVGYLVHRAPSADGPFEPVDHLGRDVLAVPYPPYADTTGKPGETWWYAVAAVADCGGAHGDRPGQQVVETVGDLSAPAASAAAEDGPAAVSVQVDVGTVLRRLPRPWRPTIGSEHLSHLLSPDRTGGRQIGAELTEALRIVTETLGVQSVRAHGILGDDLGVYREIDGQPVYDFTGIDRVYDLVLSLGLRPVVEFSFMPRDLAVDPSRTVFAYNAIISPPKDWDQWADLIRALVAHLVSRYGLSEVRDHWLFEVWNEPNLEVFWSGTREDYFRLYDVTARAVKAVHPELRVGGPASAAVGWIEELLDHVDSSGAALDFVSTHTYGSPPLDLRPILTRHARKEAPLWWTEWGVTPQHFNNVSESAFAAAFLARGMRSAAGRIDALAYWVASDHFEELGRPTALLHGGFGLLTVGNLRKPRYYALAMLERLGEYEVAATVSGDGAGSLVEAWPARDDSGRVTVALWNGTLDQSKTPGDPMLARSVNVEIAGLSETEYSLRHYRVDLEHSNIAAVWERIRNGADWPDEAGWQALREADRLAEMHPPSLVKVAGGRYALAFDLPMPAISLLELTPAAAAHR